MLTSTSLLLLGLSVFQVNSHRVFFHGRARGGNLGDVQSQESMTSLRDSRFFSKSSPSGHSRNKSIAIKWFQQHLDHFNCLDTDTWQQRYFVNDEFYSKGGPVFLMVGGEGEASERWMSEGAWIEYAKAHKALLFQLEHRYYGKSRPTPDLKVENLQYLTSLQALDDIAVFIKAMRKEWNLPANSTRWILFGGSYSGSLVAWARQKYPNLIHGAVSSSAPLMAVTDFKEYFKVVAESLDKANPNCLQAVAESRKQLGLMLAHRVGQQVVAKSFNLCSQIDSDNKIDFQNLYETLAGNFAGIVQYNKDNRFKVEVNLTIDDVCEIMTDNKIGTASQRLAHLNSIVLQQTNQTCLNYTYLDTITELGNITWGSESTEGGRQWMYQTCNEFGFYQTSTLNQTQQLFGEFPLSLFEKQCADLFGKQFTIDRINSAVAKTNKQYGGMNYNTERVVFIHGTVDPWHALGMTSSKNSNMPAILIEGTAHCADVYPPSEKDLSQLVAARQKISSIIGDWLKE